jgi:hypothetical protein
MMKSCCTPCTVYHSMTVVGCAGCAQGDEVERTSGYFSRPWPWDKIRRWVNPFPATGVLSMPRVLQDSEIYRGHC